MNPVSLTEHLKSLRPQVGFFVDDYTFACYCSLYLFARDFCEGVEVLDAACGYGYGSRLLGESASRVVGVDLGEEEIAFARAQYTDERVSFRVMDVTDLAFGPNSFDAVVSVETFEHLPAERSTAFIRSVKKVLRPGGLLILSTPVREVYSQIVRTPGHVNELGAREFVTLFSQEFEESRFYLLQRDGLQSRKSVSGLVKRDRFGLRRLVPRFVRQKMKKGMAGGFRGAFAKLLDYWRVEPAQGVEDLETAIFQVVVGRNGG